ncbi:hypothetical protein M091_4098 [Parabacteroides distasonis str. 3776 D15 i]|jgi:hypothetical protein|uniref:Leucine-rich repeat domain-containing protein n=1 Tax=Parabacteroides distasonis str. 3776 D15 i TaxID=1339342 RepID=A0AB34LFU4_PARDI|nr:hypothetical protein M091_4098 [Parabacteroides distasonis str. 3776 D15 i]
MVAKLTTYNISNNRLKSQPILFNNENPTKILQKRRFLKKISQ